MNISTNNIVSLSNASRRPGNRNAFRADLMQMRLQEKRREMQIREKENERIKLLTERMTEARNNFDMDPRLRQSILDSLSRQIDQIYKNRTEREAMAAEREMMRQKAVLEEATRVRDERPDNADEDKDPQEAKEAGQRDMMKGLVRLDAAQKRISTLRQTHAGLAVEAGHLHRAIHSENSNYTLIGSGHGAETVVGGQSGMGNLGDYRNQQLAKLNLGIARTDAAINQTISSMYRESARAQEGWLAEQRQSSEEECE